MEKYYNLLGLHIDDVKTYFEEHNINYTITGIKGRKDQDKLLVPKVIKISENNKGVELLITYFSNSLA